jgi:hypothetical protein
LIERLPGAQRGIEHAERSAAGGEAGGGRRSGIHFGALKRIVEYVKKAGRKEGSWACIAPQVDNPLHLSPALAR